MLVKDAQLEWVNRPLQARSQQTLERLLDATEAIIEDEGLDNATVAEIAKRAGSSVGAFYARFADKEGLMHCVFERFTDQALATAESVLVAERWENVPVVDAIETMIVFMLRVLRERRMLIVALMARSAVDPSITALSIRLHEHLCEQMRALMEARGDVIEHDEPDSAINIAVFMVLSAVESRVIYAWGDAKQTPDETLAAELTRMVVSYLGIESKYGVYAPHPETSDSKQKSRPARTARQDQKRDAAS